MPHMTIDAPDELLQQLRQIATDRHTTVAVIIREALEEKVKNQRPRPRSLGIAASGHRDTAERASDERPIPRSWR
jgi:predicted transcriptional regulator